MKKFLVVLLLLLGCVGTGFAGFWLAEHQMTAPEQIVIAPNVTPTNFNTTAASGEAVAEDEPEEDNITELTFAACGDNLINSFLYSQAKARVDEKDRYDFSYCYEKVADFFQKTDLNWMNQETLVSDTLKPSSYPRFSSPGDVVRNLYDINFRVFNISTNHTYDQGEEGLNATQKFWKSMKKDHDDILSTGLVKNNKYKDIPILEKDDIKFAFLSYTYSTNGLEVSSSSKNHVIYLDETDKIKKQVKLARKKADVVIVSCHWGIEDSHNTQPSQKELAKKLTGWGADLIIGTHPHVVQDCSWIKSKGRKAFCAYSLGNFISGQEKADNLIGAVLSLTFEIKEEAKTGTKTLTIKDPKLIPTVTDYRKNHKKIRVYWMKDYTKKLADSHGVRQFTKQFDFDHIKEVVNENISKKYLKMDPNEE